MASLDLLVPTPADLASWKGLESVDDLDEPVQQVQLFLQLATDLLVLTTGITEAPDPNTALGRIARAGIIDMAWYIGTSLEDRDAMFSPFSSERIGSYSYSKAAQSASTATTGVPFFDTAVKWLTDSMDASDDGGISMSSENVFPQPYREFLRERALPGAFPHEFDPSTYIL